MLRVKSLPINFKARPYQQNLIHAFMKEKNPCRRAFIVAHRRAGKDLSCWIIMFLKALQRKGTYYYLFPTARQGRKAIWLGGYHCTIALSADISAPDIPTPIIAWAKVSCQVWVE